MLSAQLAIGLTFGRRFCLPCLVYFTLIQPRIGEGELEDSRAPRLANRIGMVVLGSAALTWWLGSPTGGTVIGALASSLAWLSALTGLCVGYELYRLIARLRGITPSHHSQLDPRDLGEYAGSGRLHVQFTHPLCGDCSRWYERLSSRPEPVLVIDVRARPDLARKYNVAVVPTIVVVAAGGAVVERLA